MTQELESENAALRNRVRELEALVSGLRTNALDAFADASPGWFWEMNEDLRFTYFSPSVTRITGLPAEWHYGKTRAELGIPDEVSARAWKEHIAILGRHEPFRDFTFRRAGPDGVRWMRTSGVPVFSPAGEFRGYRGTATDVTEEIQARRSAERLTAAVEALTEIFALWDEDDRLVVCNARFREINAAMRRPLALGTRFEDYLREALAAGLYPQARGRDEEWLAERLHRHRFPGEPFEIEHQDGRCLLLREQRLPDGSTATISADITEQRAARERIALERDLLSAVVTHSPVILWSMDRDGVIRLSEGQALAGQGVRPGELVGRSIFDVYRDAPDFLANVRRALAGESFSAENETAGRVYERWFEPLRDADTNVVGVMGVSVDITERRRMLAEMERLATLDSLTGLLNRRRFLELLEDELQRRRRRRSSISVLVVDVDRFKEINDRYGHAVGDDVLRAVGWAMLSTVREVDKAGRIGGEEFAILLPETALPDGVLTAERIRKSIASLSFAAAGATISVTASIGAAEVGEDDSAADVLARADARLYAAKRLGRNRVVDRDPSPT